MNEALTIYFQGEKDAGAALAAIGLAIGAGAIALLLYGPQFKALALTLAVWAVLQLAIGAGLYLKTGAQVAGLSRQLAEGPEAFLAAETPRMIGVQRTFLIVEYVWLAMIVSGALLAFTRKSDSTVSGVALGMLVNAALLLSFDIIAERRGSVYLAALRSQSSEQP